MTVTQADFIIGKFGGQQALGRAINRRQSTVFGWKLSGFIPPRHHQGILAAAEKLNIPLSPSDFSQHLQPTVAA
jgi:hypothetical protein